jgi:2',3'-cyclic-nucleotide 2'-phosphodiesterase
MRILFLGDIFGPAGLRAVEARVAGLRRDLDLDLVLANGENVADGAGITGRLADRILAAGVDGVTLGNHTWRRNGIGPYLTGTDRVVRPANLLETLPGRGIAFVPAADGTTVAVLNLLGRLTLEPARSPFEIVDALVAEAAARTPFILLDLHAEATSEKVAMGWHLAGRVTAVVGTHTHVQTNDARVLEGGTAYITDLGMTGPHDSVIGVKKEIILRRFMTQQPQRSEPADGDVRLEGALIETDGDGRATTIEALRIIHES